MGSRLRYRGAKSTTRIFSASKSQDADSPGALRALADSAENAPLCLQLLPQAGELKGNNPGKLLSCVPGSFILFKRPWCEASYVKRSEICGRLRDLRPSASLLFRRRDDADPPAAAMMPVRQPPRWCRPASRRGDAAPTAPRDNAGHMILMTPRTPAIENSRPPHRQSRPADRWAP